MAGFSCKSGFASSVSMLQGARRKTKTKPTVSPGQEKNTLVPPAKSIQSPSTRGVRSLQGRALSPCCAPGTRPGAEAVEVTGEPPRSPQSEVSDRSQPDGVCVRSKEKATPGQEKGRGRDGGETNPARGPAWNSCPGALGAHAGGVSWLSHRDADLCGT